MIEIFSNLDKVIARMHRIEGVTAGRMQGLVAEIIEPATQAKMQILRDKTPRGERDPVRLADTTASMLSFTGTGKTMVRATATIYQKKTIVIHGEDEPLANVLTTGHEAPEFGIFPVNKQALFWPGLERPVAYSPGGPAAPDPYIEQAAEESIPVVEEISRRQASTFWGQVLEESLQ